MFKRNDEWLIPAGASVLIVVMDALNHEYANIGSDVAFVLMCLFYRSSLNEIDKLKSKLGTN